MNYYDEIYGDVEITEPILLDLIASAAVQRLRGVMQHGITGVIGVTTKISRFDHSMGAMLLVRRMGGSLTEQVAALLHDVSHTAFSHVIDYVYDDHDGQSYHDEHKETYVAKTDLPEILTRHGFVWEDVLDESRFSILEQPSPRLCADRVDYFLRDGRPLNLATDDDTQRVLAHLVVVNGRLAVDNLEVARWMGDTFMAADEASWANFREVGLYELTAQALRRGFEIGVIEDDDIWGTDDVLWTKLQAANDKRLRSLVRAVAAETAFVWDEANPTFHVSTKLRAIDPDVAKNGRLHPLSTIDPDFGQRRQSYLDNKRGKWPMRVIAKDGILLA